MGVESNISNDIKILFENNKLNIMKVLVLLKVLKEQNKKKFYGIDDISFYYGLVNFNLLKALDGEADTLSQDRNKYFRFSKSLNKIILILNSFGYIELESFTLDKKNKIKIRLNKKGEQFFDLIYNEPFKDLNEKYRRVLNLPNNLSNRKIIMGVE